MPLPQKLAKLALVVSAFALVYGGSYGGGYDGVARAANPVIVPTATADAPQGVGTGLCGATAISPTPALDFGNLNTGNFIGNMNSFMEAHLADRKESVIRTLLDLSNNNSSGLQSSYGDFTDVMQPLCQVGGCDFDYNDTTTSFGARYRGYLNVTPALSGKPIHLGLYADDAVSLAFFDKMGNTYPVMIRPPQLGLPTWRLTNTITFNEPGIYPLEILYAEIAEHAALEMSFLDGTFTDFELPANQMPVTSLKGAGFTLYQPVDFFQTLSGAPSYPDIDACKQCDRQFVNQAGNNGCDPGYYCNDAALCAPCDTAIFCGPTCSPCGGDTPFCINENQQIQCGQCRTSFDCKEGFQCDPLLHICQECNEDPDCPRGEICVEHSCVPCATDTQCAGTSCNCCPVGSNGKPMTCVSLEEGKPAECVECLSNSDCKEGVCDELVGMCVKELAQNEASDCCGDDCAKCPAEAPFCLPSPFGTACAECRQDMDCPEGNYCRSGICKVCVEDKRCGERCTSCGGDTPFCLDTQKAKDAVCVRCNTDDQCPGGTCDKTAHLCLPGCIELCDGATPHCFGDKCVECYADTQCPCGGTCDVETNTCSTSCRDNGDCLGSQHCHWNDEATEKECSPGSIPDEVACGSTLGNLCTGSIARGAGDPTPPAGAAALGILALLFRRIIRRRRP